MGKIWHQAIHSLHDLAFKKLFCIRWLIHFHLLQQGAFTEQHFDQDLNFHATEEDPVSKKASDLILVFHENSVAFSYTLYI